MNKTRIDVELVRQSIGEGDGLLRKINTDDAGTTPGPRQRVQAKVTLQMQHRLTLNTTDTIQHYLIQGVRVAFKTFDIVEVRFKVYAGP